MRRGGGSRGGGFSGGSRSFGGGSRGGGSRGFGGSSRMHRSSHRHYRHRSYYGPRYYGPRYYGGGYYGSRGRHYRGGGGAGLIIFLLIVLFIVALVAAAIMSAPTNLGVEMAPGQTYVVPYSSFSDGDISIDVINGQVDIYNFASEPQITGSLDSFQSESGNLPFSGDYMWFAISLGIGTDVVVDWSSTSDLTYYAIRGDSNLNSWEDGSDNQFFSQFGTSGSHVFTVNRADTYYFAMEAGWTGSSFDIVFAFSIPTHDLNSPISTWSGSTYLSSSDISGDSIILENSGTTDATVDIIVYSSFSFGQVFLSMAVVTAGIVYLVKRRNKNKEVPTEQRSPLAVSTAPALDSSSVEGAGDFEKPAKPLDKQYVTREKAAFCQNCGSGLLPESRFCIECGQSI